ncbi:MAG: hypothetical protein GY856_07845 [bacterium]|nr:hypothetical protein [bacterium]
MEKRWSKTEITYLKRHATSGSVEELAQRLHTDPKTIRRKLAELGLTPTQSFQPEAEAAFEHYTEAVKLLQEKRYAEAAPLFETVITEVDRRQLIDRARQHLEICRRQLAELPAEADPYLEAVFEKNRGNLEAARELCSQLPPEAEDERTAYLLASLQALSGSTEEALETLETAIRLDPKNRVHAYHDPDFAELRGLQEFTNLFTGSS